MATGEELVNRIIAGTNNGNPNSHYTKLVADPNNPAQIIMYDNRAKQFDPVLPSSGGAWDSGWTGLGAGSMATPDPSNNEGVYGQGVAYKYENTTITGGDITLQIGETADTVNQMAIDLPDMSLNKIGIDPLIVDPADQAMASMEKVKNGINYVSSERGRMGAYQNRLEHTMENLSAVRENLQDAESTVRDVDVAEEMMIYTKANIINQSAQSMLAQANQVPQSVLQLMQ